MTQLKQALWATALIAGLCLTAQAQDTAAPAAPGQSDQSSDQSIGQQPAATPLPGQASDSQTDLGTAQPAGERQPADPASGARAATSPDAMFVKHAAMGNLKAVKLAEIASQKSSSQEVKDVAQEILRDHQQAGTELSALSQKLGVQVPQALPAGKSEMISYFESLQGKQFDQEYISCVKADHAAAISMLQDRAQIAENPEVKQWAQQCLSKMQQHQQTVTAAAQSVGLPTETATAQGQSTETARPAGATIDGSSSDQQQQQQQTPSDNSSGGTSGAPGASLQQRSDR